MTAMRYSLLPLAVRTSPLNLMDATAHLNADSYLFTCFVGLIGIPGGTGSILVSRLSTAWHEATSTTPRNTLTASAGAGVFTQSRHPRHDKPSPHTVMLVLLLVAMPVGLVYFLVLRISAWLAASFTFSMLALIFLCIAVRLPSPLRSTHLPLGLFFADHRVASRGIFHYRLYVQTWVRPGHVCAANPFRSHGLGGRAVTCFMFRTSVRYWFACPQPHIMMTLGRGRMHFRDKITHTLKCNLHILSCINYCACE